MAVTLNHTIVWSKDSAKSAAFLAEMLGMPAPTRHSHFHVVTTANDVSIDFAERDGEIAPQHYAFLVSEPEFDAVLGRIEARGLDYWADPGQTRKGEINPRDGGRGLYFEDPSGHLMEALTRPYGSGAASVND